MRTYIKIIILSSVLIVLGLLILVPGRKAARKHVNYITATEDHPLNCLRCHMYTQKDGLIAKAINADYLSPFNMAISSDGATLYVVAQEANALVVVDIGSEKVVDRIEVGERPHSVVLKRDGNTAFVSNQWADNIYKVDLTENNAHIFGEFNKIRVNIVNFMCRMIKNDSRVKKCFSYFK